MGPIAGHLGEGRARPGPGHQLWVKLMTRYMNDQRALIGIIRSVPELVVSEEALRAVSLPLCSIAGSRDPLMESARAMCSVLPEFAVIAIPGADHIQAPARPELHAALSRFLLGVELGATAGRVDTRCEDSCSA